MPSNAWNKESVGQIFDIDQPDILNVQLVSTDKQLGEIVPFKRLSTKDPMTVYLKHASPTTKMFFQTVYHQYLIIPLNKDLFLHITSYKAPH